MRAGEFPDARAPCAKIDMASGNINLRDPALYRIKHVEHQNTGNAWPIYPMYDFAHALGDSIEASPTRCARWNSKTTARCATGAWTTSISPMTTH